MAVYLGLDGHALVNVLRDTELQLDKRLSHLF